MCERESVSDYSKRYIIDKEDYKSLLSKDLSDFASKKSFF